LNVVRLASGIVPALSLFVSPVAAVAAGGPAHAASAAPLRHLRDGVEARSGAGHLKITALTDTTLRVRIGRASALGEDASWAVPANVRNRSVAVEPTARGFRTGSVEVAVDPATLKVELFDLHGKLISADSTAIRFDGKSFELRKAMPLGEHYFGMGDKTGVLDRRGYTFVNWNSDTYGFTPSISKHVRFWPQRRRHAADQLGRWARRLLSDRGARRPGCCSALR
jgi:alpha-glucosidase